MAKGLKFTNYNFKGQTGKYVGKVRDVYELGKKLVVVASDRISAFDVVLPYPIPYKGQVLNQTAAWCLEAASDIVPNWVESVPDPNVTIGKKCDPFAVEMVIRAYLVGHAWREYYDGKRTLCGVALPEGLKENDPLPFPIITPTTKSTQGHDKDITKAHIISQGIVSTPIYRQLEEYTHQLFERGSAIAAQRGLILADTKYEFGLYEGRITLMDEIHTPDSSRYFYQNTYEERQKKREPQKQMSKEFVRQWLISQNFQGKKGQKTPVMTPERIHAVSQRYIEIFENLTGQAFKRVDTQNIEQRIKTNTEEAIHAIK